MRITDIVLTRVHGHYHGPRFPPGNSQITQLALYPPLSPGRSPESTDAERLICCPPPGPEAHGVGYC